ncbi:MAG TPA: Mur ligase family protein [Actinomycetes bacterium]|nr:Mur ligase family protein [Actinomycetes bacterium]
MSPPHPENLVELRVLDGPNLYFPRPAIKLTLEVSELLALPETEAVAVAEQAALPGLAASPEAPASGPEDRPAGPHRLKRMRPGPAGRPGSEQRRRFVARLGAHLVRRTATAAGVGRLAVRGRPGPEPTQVVLAWPWRRRNAAEALGEEVAALLEGLTVRPDLVERVRPDRVERLRPDRADLAEQIRPDLAEQVRAAGSRLREVEPGPGPTLPDPDIPVVAVTGTNGKTTVTRLVAHMGRRAGLRVGWSNTDGIYLDGELVDAGDWSGPGGARRVLSEPGVELAVLETARGGILRRGVGVAHNDVAVVTNISPDHLGLGGIDTLDQLAEVKATVVKITRPTGWVVLNADDPRTLAMRRLSRARPFLFGLDPDAPGLREALEEGGRAATVLDGDLVVLTGRQVDRLLPVVDAPVTLAGISSANLANALAAAAAGLGLGLPRAAVVEGLRTFAPDLAQNPTRMNVWALDDRTVVVDVAHNEESLRALLEVCRGLCRNGAAVRIGIGTAGDRPDSVLRLLGELAARGADRVVVVEKERYLRGRDRAGMTRLLQEGARAGGKADVPAFPDELDGIEALVGESEPGDVCALMCHTHRDEVAAWLRDRGAGLAGPDDLRALVLAARGG